MQYSDIDFKIKRNSKDLCGTYGMVFYENYAVWYKHRCNRLDCPRCRDYYIARWKDRIALTFDETIYMVNIKHSQFSSFRHKHNKIPYVKIRFTNHYTIIINTEVPRSVPVTATEVLDIIDSQHTHVKNFITANRAFYREASSHLLHIRKDDNMQKVARGEFLGRAVRPLDDDDPRGIISSWHTSSIKEKASILKGLHNNGVLRLTDVGKKIVEMYGDGDEFCIKFKYPGFVLDKRAITIFETRGYIGYIIPSRK
jgi:hypothetical protein